MSCYLLYILSLVASVQHYCYTLAEQHTYVCVVSETGHTFACTHNWGIWSSGGKCNVCIWVSGWTYATDNFAHSSMPDSHVLLQIGAADFANTFWPKSVRYLRECFPTHLRVWTPAALIRWWKKPNRWDAVVITSAAIIERERER